MRHATRGRSAALMVAALLVLTGCGDNRVEEGPDAIASPLPDGGDTATGAPSPSDGAASNDPSDGAGDGDGTALGGEPYDGPPTQGAPAVLAVIGVAATDVLNVRAGPGTAQEIVATLPPLATDVRATGRGRMLPTSIWLEVEVDGGTGWVSSKFLAHLGATEDITAQLRTGGGSLPSAETLSELAAAVADLLGSQDPPSRIVVSDGPSVGDLAEVTVDIVGLADDSVFALRALIFAVDDDSGEGFTVRTVEATRFCGRGPDDDEDGCP